MTPGLTGPHRPRTSEALRRCYAGAALLLAVAVVVPPLYGLARRYEFAEAVQFSVYAMAVPALLVLGAPWEGVHLANGGRLSAWIDRLGSGRRLHRSATRSALFLGGFMAAAVAWRTPVAVAALERDPWLVAVEGASLVVAGAGFWLELVESGRLVPRARRPVRGVMAAVGMWTVWTISYLGGFSSTSWYTGFHHSAGGLSAGADQQFSTAVCWLVAALAFMPVVFWNLLVWLRSEEEVEPARGTPVPEARRSRMGGSPVSS
jgi:cytochrome c oxidase assembly factor CtaG